MRLDAMGAPMIPRPRKPTFPWNSTPPPPAKAANHKQADSDEQGALDRPAIGMSHWSRRLRMPQQNSQHCNMPGSGRVGSRHVRRRKGISAPCPPEDEDAEAAPDTTRRRDSLREGGSSAGAALAERKAAAAMADGCWLLLLRPAGGPVVGCGTREISCHVRLPLWTLRSTLPLGGLGACAGGPIWARRLTGEGKVGFSSLGRRDYSISIRYTFRLQIFLPSYCTTFVCIW